MAEIFNDLNAVDVSAHHETKSNGRKELTYLSWPWAWAEVKKRYPDANYTIEKNPQGLPYFEDPKSGIMVFTTVTIGGMTHEMWLPVMDSYNNAMRFEPYNAVKLNGQTQRVNAATMWDVNKTAMRCLTKNLAMFGLGLYIYAGEDLPEDVKAEKQQNAPAAAPQTEPQTEPKAQPAPVNVTKEKPTYPPQSTPTEGMSAGDYIRQELIAIQMGMQELANCRKVLVDTKIVPDIPTSKMSLQEAQEFIKALRANFR